VQKFLAVVALLGLGSGLYGSKIDLGAPDSNVELQQEEMSKFFDSLAHEKPTLNVRRAAASMKGKKFATSKNHWKEGTEDPYKRAAALREAKGYAGAGLASVGSSMAPQMEQLLAQTAAQMIATGDPQFVGVGNSMQQESAAIGANNKDAAQTAAEQVNSTPRPDLSNYSATPGDISYGSQAAQAEAQVAGAVLTAVGTVAGGIIGAYCSFGGGTAVGAMYGAALGNMAGSAVGSAIDGQQSNTAAQGAAIGVQAIQAGSQASLQKVQGSGLGQQGGGSGAQSAPTGAFQGAPTGNGTTSGSTAPATGNTTNGLGGSTNM
jgi:hypothetical protein